MIGQTKAARLSGVSPLLTRIADSIAPCRADMLDFAKRLIALPTENPPGNNYEQALELLSSHLQKLGFEAERIGDCLICYAGEGERTLYFSGHFDVVPAQNRSQFEPAIRGKNLFGRGSSDMKGGLAAMIYAAKAVRDSGVRLHGRIGLVFVPDEETSGPRGSRYLDEQGLLGRNGIGMLTPEPTAGIVWNANRGAITLKITVEGKPAHVGRQFDGINAFEGMMEIVGELAKMKEHVETRVSDFPIQPEAARNWTRCLPEARIRTRSGEKMQHGVLGPGGVGGLIGAVLADAGEETTVIVRPGAESLYPREISLESPFQESTGVTSLERIGCERPSRREYRKQASIRDCR